MNEERIIEKETDQSKVHFHLSASVSAFGKKIKRSTRIKEAFIKIFFGINGVMALIFLILIFVFLFKEGIRALDHIGILEFFAHKTITPDGEIQWLFEWYPTSDIPRYSLVPLLLGTILIAIPAVIISTVFGIASGIYLSEIANPKLKDLI